MDPSHYLKTLLVANSATQAMQAAVDRVREVFACAVSWTGLLHDDCLHIGAHSGLRTSEMPGTWRLEIGAGIGGRAAQLRRAHKSNDYQHDARRVPAKRVIDNEGIVAVLVVPILAADRTLGVLYAASRTPRRWTDEQARLLEAISHYLAVRLKQLDVDGRIEAEAEKQRMRADATTATLRSTAELVNSLTRSTHLEAAMESTAAAAHARVELRDESGSLLHAAGRASTPGQRPFLSGELDSGTGLVLALFTVHPNDSIGDPAIRLAYDALRLQLLRLREREQTTETLRGELFDQLLTGRFVDTQDLHRRLIVIGRGGLARGAQALVIGTRNAEAGISKRMTDDLRTTFPHCLLAYRDDRMVALIDLDSMPQEQIEQRLEDLLTRERSRQGAESSALMVGMGRACHDLLDISMSYDEARASCEVGLSSEHRSQSGVLSARSLGIQGLASLPLAQLRTTVTDTFGPLLESDRQRGTHHLATVRTFLANDRHIPDTATDLRVHYNTVRNRIARIEHLLGVDLGDVNDRFRVETALRMEAVLRALSKRTSHPVT